MSKTTIFTNIFKAAIIMGVSILFNDTIKGIIIWIAVLTLLAIARDKRYKKLEDSLEEYGSGDDDDSKNND